MGEVECKWGGVGGRWRRRRRGDRPGVVQEKLEVNDMYSRGCSVLTQHTSIITYTSTRAHTSTAGAPK